ncbi:TetR/AcrR family transcriptional regulator [Pseudarthrobacter sp. AL07]|nr:TetR/AcrR family transcriptional regulator [Pseudarthrobacter sp. AL07]MDI3210106.1 TetR/AcrR family transcriptional regulator [Pseudarthrobacter sp. AL07]
MRLPARKRKEQLIAATIELMRHEGVQSVTMRAIAKEANAPLAMANYCFSNKENLMDVAAEAWFKNLSRFSSGAPANLGLRKAAEHVAEGCWRALEEEPASILAEIELILWATRNADVSPLATKIYSVYEVELGIYSPSPPKAAGTVSHILPFAGKGLFDDLRRSGHSVPDRPKGC